MRKLLLAVATAVMLMAGSLPAHANIFGDNCVTRTNPAGGKKIEVCAAIGQGVGTTWARVEFHKVTGYDLPYAANAIVRLWSHRRSDTAPYNWCAGNTNTCNGVGDGSLYVHNMQNADAPYSDGSDHYTNSEHYCIVHSTVLNGWDVWWTQNDWNNSIPSDSYSAFNSLGDYDMGDNCNQ